MKRIKQITVENLYPISIGAAMLGTGGGGDPKIGYLMAKQAIENHGPVSLVQLHEVNDEATVAALSMMGAPSVVLEKIPNGREFNQLFEKIEDDFTVKIDYLYPVEAGGINSMIPIIGAAQKRVPLIDADTMGRAFPELQMVTLAIFDINAFPIFLASDSGKLEMIDADNYQELELKARKWTVENGGQAAVGDGVLKAKDFKKAAIADVVNLSYQLGTIILERDNPIEKLQSLGVNILARAKIVDVERKTEGGFNRGIVKLSGIEENQVSDYELHLQNENLAVFEQKKLLCSVPDLIMLLDYQTLLPVTTDSYKFGQRVIITALRCDDKWKLEKGLELVGPRAFGYDFDYTETLKGGQDV